MQCFRLTIFLSCVCQVYESIARKRTHMYLVFRFRLLYFPGQAVCNTS